MIEISVIIATHNRAPLLRACLESLARQTHPAAEFEVIVVVDGSTDGTAAMLAGLNMPFALRVVTQANAGQAAALNRALPLAADRYCLFLDDDLVAHPALVAAHLAAHREQSGAVVLGRLETVAPAGADGLSRWMARRLNQHFARLADGTRPLSYMDCYIGNLSVARDELLACGGFTTDLPRAHDLEVGYRLARHGLSLRYAPAAVCRQQFTKRYRDVIADAEREGEAGVELFRGYPPMLAGLPLGRFNEASPRALLLRRALLALGVGPGLLARMVPLLGGDARRTRAYRFLHSYCYWRGVRRAADLDTWRWLHALRAAAGEPPRAANFPRRISHGS